MKIKIHDEEIELRYSMRSFIIYEEIVGKSLNLEDINSLTSITNLFYANVLATLQYYGKPLDFTYNDFWRYIDDNGGVKIITEFSEWYMKQLQAQADFNSLKPEKEVTETNNEKIKN